VRSRITPGGEPGYQAVRRRISARARTVWHGRIPRRVRAVFMECGRVVARDGRESGAEVPQFRLLIPYDGHPGIARRVPGRCIDTASHVASRILASIFPVRKGHPSDVAIIFVNHRKW
jgi:hypothetical protein